MINENNGINYKIAICDDDKNYVEYIENLIRGCFNGKLEFFSYSSGEQLLNDVDVMHDVVFIDMQLGGIDGTETARKLREANRNAVLVFCSGVVNPTPESIKVTPYRFLLKQFDDKTMCKEITEILDKMIRSYKEEYILTRSDDGITRVYINDIAYVSKAKRGSCIHLVDPAKYEVDGELITYLHVSVLYEQLHKYGFEFAHNSYLVNCRWVVRFDKTYLVLEGGGELNISRSHYADFKKSFIKFWDKYGGGEYVD